VVMDMNGANPTLASFFYKLAKYIKSDLSTAPLPLYLRSVSTTELSTLAVAKAEVVLEQLAFIVKSSVLRTVLIPPSSAAASDDHADEDPEPADLHHHIPGQIVTALCLEHVLVRLLTGQQQTARVAQLRSLGVIKSLHDFGIISLWSSPLVHPLTLSARDVTVLPTLPSAVVTKMPKLLRPRIRGACNAAALLGDDSLTDPQPKVIDPATFRYGVENLVESFFFDMAAAASSRATRTSKRPIKVLPKDLRRARLPSVFKVISPGQPLSLSQVARSIIGQAKGALPAASTLAPAWSALINRTGLHAEEKIFEAILSYISEESAAVYFFTKTLRRDPLDAHAVALPGKSSKQDERDKAIRDVLGVLAAQAVGYAINGGFASVNEPEALATAAFSSLMGNPEQAEATRTRKKRGVGFLKQHLLLLGVKLQGRARPLFSVTQKKGRKPLDVASLLRAKTSTRFDVKPVPDWEDLIDLFGPQVSGDQRPWVFKRDIIDSAAVTDSDSGDQDHRDTGNRNGTTKSRKRRASANRAGRGRDSQAVHDGGDVRDDEDEEGQEEEDAAADKEVHALAAGDDHDNDDDDDDDDADDESDPDYAFDKDASYYYRRFLQYKLDLETGMFKALVQWERVADGTYYQPSWEPEENLSPEVVAKMEQGVPAFQLTEVIDHPPLPGGPTRSQRDQPALTDV